ncbi:MAG: hypothetical protein IJD74_03025 [Clostridia bacterium]|nr:hypothetical protein [Clostridia bacterium]
MTDKLLGALMEKYTLTKLDAGEFASLKASGMKFSVEAYCAEGLGHVSVMRAKGFFGLMKMDTLMIVPTDIDLPLYSYDRIYAMGNDTLIVELYNTLIADTDLSALDGVKAKFAELPERDPGEHWYDSIKLAQSISKKGKKALKNSFDAFAEEHFNAYLNANADQVTLTAEKKELSARYVDGLLSQGGPSTDVFKKELGQEKTSLLFKRVLFGTDL